MTPQAPRFGRISICIPTYNGARHLKAAIRSATAQTLSAHEILVVDDGSTDDTLAVAGRAAGADPRIKIVQNPVRLGLVENWNRCTGLASGDWIKFLFQDDLLSPTCLSVLSSGMERVGADLGFVGRTLLLESGSRRERAMARGIRRAQLGPSIGHPQLLTPGEIRELVMASPTRNVFGEPTAAMFRRDLIESLGPFDSTLHQLCDWEFWIRVGAQRGLWFDPTQLATFRLHSESVSSQNQIWSSGAADPQLLDAIRMKEKILFDDGFAALRQDAPVGQLRSIERQLQRHLYRLELSSPRDARSSPRHRSPTSSSVRPASAGQRCVERVRWLLRVCARRVLR